MPDTNKQSRVANATHKNILIANTTPQSWLTHRRTYDEQRFSPLTQITTTNVDEPPLDWHLDLFTHRGLEGMPIFVDAIIYLSYAFNNIYAVSAITGEQLCNYDPHLARVNNDC